MRQLPCACFASSPVSIQNKPAPICFSTLIFNFFTFFFSTKLVGTCFVRRAECEKPRRLLRGRARRKFGDNETRSESVATVNGQNATPKSKTRSSLSINERRTPRRGGRDSRSAFGGNVAKNEKRNARNGALYVARRLFRKERAPVVFQRFGVKFKERPKEKKENGALAKKTLAARPTPQTLQKNDYLRMPRRLMSVT